MKPINCYLNRSCINPFDCAMCTTINQCTHPIDYFECSDLWENDEGYLDDLNSRNVDYNIQQRVLNEVADEKEIALYEKIKRYQVKI